MLGWRGALWLVVVAALLAPTLAACSATIPDGVLICGASEPCPPGFVCRSGLCYRGDVEDSGEMADAVMTIDAPAGDAPAGDAPRDDSTVSDAPIDVTSDDAPTDSPVDAPGDAPDDAPADAPDDAPTDAPSDAPTDGPMCVATTERCDGVDNDCDMLVDDDPASASCVAPQVAMSACSGGACRVVSCNANRGDCDTVYSNGCEVNLNTNAMHCSMCGLACGPYANGTASCVAGTCTVTCAPPNQNCNSMLTDGCESDTSRDVANCGSCGRMCTSGPHSIPRCTASTCTLVCDTGYANCDFNAVTGCESQTDVDPDNCGSCGVVCTGGRVCMGGACV